MIFFDSMTILFVKIENNLVYWYEERVIFFYLVLKVQNSNWKIHFVLFDMFYAILMIHFRKLLNFGNCHLQTEQK